jgi:hypothetical protein
MKEKTKKEMIIYKYGTGQPIPKGGIYLATVVNGDMPEEDTSQNKKYVWHYFMFEL